MKKIVLFIKELFERSSVVKTSETFEGKKILVTVNPINCGIAIINEYKKKELQTCWKHAWYSN